ncbi:MAG: hypothetical protein AMXMBFR50_27280 [Ignavibacterium album]
MNSDVGSKSNRIVTPKVARRIKRVTFLLILYVTNNKPSIIDNPAERDIVANTPRMRITIPRIKKLLKIPDLLSR